MTYNRNEFDGKSGRRTQETFRGLNSFAALRVGRQSSLQLLTLSCQRHHGNFSLRRHSTPQLVSG
ncbi:hypothetical protein EV363DRAFT_1168350 [Boletus edulis]|nr:hypothetical protein EV363DRAFT_1168350 [Boletus edulis]